MNKDRIFSYQSDLEELTQVILSKDRLGFMRRRQELVRQYGYDKFKELLDEAIKNTNEGER